MFQIEDFSLNLQMKLFVTQYYNDIFSKMDICQFHGQTDKPLMILDFKFFKIKGITSDFHHFNF